MLSFAPIDAPVAAAAVVLDHLSAVLDPVGGTATAIVLLTVLVRLALHPLTRVAVRGERARQRLAPRIAELRARRTKDPQRLSAEIVELHRAEGVSPFAGLLPTLAQAPVLLLMYRLAAHLHDGGHNLFGVALIARALATPLPQVWVPLALVGALALVAWLTSRRAGRLAAALPGPAASGPLARLPRIAPFLTPATALLLPMTVSLYLLTSSAWTLAENTLLHRGMLS